MTTITTQRLLLRPLQEGDAEALVRGLNNFNVAKWTARVPFPYGVMDARNFIALCANPEDCTLRLCITFRGDLIGVISCEQTHDGIAAELGYWLAEPHWGKGFGKEAAQAIAAHAFGQIRHDLLVAGYREGNEASRRILDGLGFEMTGRRQVFSAAANANVPVIRMALSRGRWQDVGGRRP